MQFHQHWYFSYPGYSDPTALNVSTCYSRWPLRTHIIARMRKLSSDSYSYDHTCMTLIRKFQLFPPFYFGYWNYFRSVMEPFQIRHGVFYYSKKIKNNLLHFKETFRMLHTTPFSAMRISILRKLTFTLIYYSLSHTIFQGQCYFMFYEKYSEMAFH